MELEDIKRIQRLVSNLTIEEVEQAIDKAVENCEVHCSECIEAWLRSRKVNVPIRTTNPYKYVTSYAHVYEYHNTRFRLNVVHPLNKKS